MIGSWILCLYVSSSRKVLTWSSVTKEAIQKQNHSSPTKFHGSSEGVSFSFQNYSQSEERTNDTNPQEELWTQLGDEDEESEWLSEMDSRNGNNFDVGPSTLPQETLDQSPLTVQRRISMTIRKTRVRVLQLISEEGMRQSTSFLPHPPSPRGAMWLSRLSQFDSFIISLW